MNGDTFGTESALYNCSLGGQCYTTVLCKDCASAERSFWLQAPGKTAANCWETGFGAILLELHFLSTHKIEER